MKKILCPTDFSESSRNAIVYAAKLAGKLNADVTLFNVKSVFDFAPIEMLRGTQMTLEGISEELEDLSQEVTKVFKISCYPEVQPSARPLADIISERALDFDLMVMGTNGPEDLYQFFNGSNTYNVIRKASVPVMLVPEKYSYTDLGRIVYAFDYLKERNLPLTQLIPLLETFNSQLHVLQVLDENKKGTELNIAELQTLAAQDEDMHPFILETIKSSDVPRSIHSYVLRNEADLLVLYAPHYSFLEKIFHKSVIKVISGIADYPVFVVHQ